MCFATRAFAFCCIPLAALLGASYWATRLTVQRNVREQLRAAMRDKQVAAARLRTRSQLQTGRFLRFAGDDQALQKAVRALDREPDNGDARRAVNAQLQEISNRLGCKLLSIANFRGTPLTWVVRERDAAEEVPEDKPAPLVPGLAMFRSQLYQLVSAPLDDGDENLGILTAGDRFDLAEFGVPMVVFQNGQMVRSSFGGATMEQLSAALAPCGEHPDCEIRLKGDAYLSVEVKDASFGPGYVLRSMQNIDAAAAPVQAGLNRVFLNASIGALLGALIFGMAASRSMVRSLAQVVSHLRKSEAAGLLMELPVEYNRIVEIRDLIRSFNQAAASIRDARDGLNAAYVEFVGSLANALDARDRYTAGHSQRVSGIAVSIARSMELSAEEQDRVRIGALLHDIGKIGIPDSVLQKPGVLSDAEFALIKQHPSIGCKILECVNGLSPYLQAIEFHHENWDGTGYPRGLRGEETPIAARIIHVADAFDAMTTDRPYRSGFTCARAMAIIRINAGTQFDPQIVDVFSRLMPAQTDEEYHSILRLAAAVGQSQAVTQAVRKEVE